MTNNNNYSVKLVNADLTENKKELTGKDSNRLEGTLNLNGLDLPFKLRYESTEKSKSIYSPEEIEKRKSDHTDVIVVENEDSWILDIFDVTVSGVDEKTLKSTGIKLNFSEIYSYFKELRNNNSKLEKSAYIGKKQESYIESWFVKNLELINSRVVKGVAVSVNPSLSVYTDADHKYYGDIYYTITYSYKNQTSVQTLKANHTSSDRFGLRSHFSGYKLESGMDYLGLFKTVDGLVTRITKEYDKLVEKIDYQLESKKEKESTLSFVQRLFGDNVKLVSNTNYSEGRNRHSYTTEHYEAVFNLLVKKDKTYSNMMTYSGTGIQFTLESVNNTSVKSISIKAIIGAFKNNKDYLEFVSLIMDNRVTTKEAININPIKNNVTSDGMVKIMYFVEKVLRPIEISKYDWKSVIE